MSNSYVNSPSYWDYRFQSGDWEQNGGRTQTRLFAEQQISLLGLGSGFSGHIVDFGCGLGDAMEVYREAFPQASLTGIDISDAAISLCKERYGDIAQFISGDHHAVPDVDVIITSNVLEHLADYEKIVACLSRKCETLYIIVPYREILTLGGEHINAFDDNSFATYRVLRKKVFACRGWSQYGLMGVFWGIYIKNVAKVMLGRQVRRRNLQVMFEIEGRRTS